MVDAERLHRILRRVSDDVRRLRRLAPADPQELLRDEVRLGYCKYLFVTAIEGCIDAAQHVVASEGYRAPTDNADAMRLLARHDHLDHDLAERLAQAVGFRNILVHGYRDVDDRVVVANLGRLVDLDGFDALTLLVS